MGKRRRRAPRVLKECNRSSRLGKIIGRALAGIIDPACPEMSTATQRLAEACGLAQFVNGPGDGAADQMIPGAAKEQVFASGAVQGGDVRALLFDRFRQAQELGLIAPGMNLESVEISADGISLESTYSRSYPGVSVEVRQVADVQPCAENPCSVDQPRTDGQSVSIPLGTAATSRDPTG
jgi:hypothetical protein